MPRKIKTASRTLSNVGPHGQFIGQMPGKRRSALPGEFPPSSVTGVPESPEDDPDLQFSSIAEMYACAWLKWRKDLGRVEFEPREYNFEAVGDLPALRCIPDFGVNFLATGELGVVECKYSPESLDPEEEARLKLEQRHFERIGFSWELVYRSKLEESGFIDTVMLLGRYEELVFSERRVKSALALLTPHPQTDLPGWRMRARQAGIPIGLLYQLLYRQYLPLTYRRLLPIELRPWLA